MYYLKNKIFSDILVFILLAVCGFLIYSNTFDASFHLDDGNNIVSNPNIHMEEFSWSRLIYSCFPEYQLDRPIAYMTFALNYYFGGLDVFGYHLVNLIIHIVAAAGVYLLIKQSVELHNSGTESAYNPRIIGAVTAILWLTSAVQTQAVTYIIQRMTSLASLFYIFAFIFYIKGRISTDKKRFPYLLISLLLLIAALGTKEISLVFPLFVILYEFCFLSDRTAKGELNKWYYLFAFFTLTVVFLFFVYTVYDKLEDYIEIGIYPQFGYAVKERLLTEVRIIIFYISLLIFPVSSRMALFHDFPLSRGLLNPISTLPSLVLILFMITFFLYRIKRDPFVSFFGLWFIIKLLPESLWMGIELLFEHRLYLPSVGFYAVAVFLLFRIWTMFRLRSRSLWGLFAVLFVLFSINTFNRNRDWHDNISLWSDNVYKAPLIPEPHEGLGLAYLKNNKLDEAEREFLEVKKLDPLSQIGGIGLGITYFKKGKPEKAFRELEYVITRRETGADLRYIGSDEVFLEMGRELSKAGRRFDAIKVLRYGLELYPDSEYIKRELYELQRRF